MRLVHLVSFSLAGGAAAIGSAHAAHTRSVQLQLLVTGVTSCTWRLVMLSLMPSAAPKPRPGGPGLPRSPGSLGRHRRRDGARGVGKAVGERGPVAAGRHDVALPEAEIGIVAQLLDETVVAVSSAPLPESEIFAGSPEVGRAKPTDRSAAHQPLCRPPMSPGTPARQPTRAVYPWAVGTSPVDAHAPAHLAQCRDGQRRRAAAADGRLACLRRTSAPACVGHQMSGLAV
jgi:hypothetical protein